MSYEFVNVNVGQIEEKIKLKERASTDGKNNLPRASSETFSICENEAIITVDEFRHNQISKAINFLASIKNKIIDSTAELGQKHFFIDNLKNRIEETLNSARGRLSNLKNSYSTQDKDIRNFKLENNLDREPNTLTPNKILIGICIVVILFIVETYLNGNLLAGSLSKGQKGGLAYSSAIAGLNVLVSFAIGYFVLKTFHHVDQTKRIFSKFGLTIYLIFIGYLNWMLGAFRSVFKSTGITASERFVTTSSKTDTVEKVFSPTTVIDPIFPWTVHLDPMSLILVFIGLSFALISLVDGYYFDDTYPGYGRVGKQRSQDKEEIDRIRENLLREVTLIIKEEINKTGDKRSLILQETLRKKWINSITDLENTFEGYRRFADQLDDALDHTIGEYRTTNSMFRTEDAPQYWRDDKGKVKTRYYNLRETKKDPQHVFKDYALLYLNKEEIEKKIEFYQNKIQEEANSFINDINLYNSDINKRVDEMRVKYNVQ